MRRFMFIAVILSAALTAGALADDKNSGKAYIVSPMFQEILDCKALEASEERLACFDRTVDTMAKAISRRDVVIAERETINDAERGLFGLGLPRIKLFGGDDDQIKEMESTITNFRRDENGALIFTIADGARWRQIDSQPQIAKVGDKVKIRKAALGSFFANINGRSGFKVTRVTN